MIAARAWLLALVVTSGGICAPSAGTAASDVLEEGFVDGSNFRRAEFRLWIPAGAAPLRATLVLVPGSNVDGRAMAEEASWRAFALRHELALVACHFADQPHSRAFIEDYVDASRGSGQALLDALQRLATRSRHPELAGAPLLLWGMSAGGEFNYEFTAWRPDRVIAFVANKGGIYYSALVPEAARAVPALLFVGRQDLAARTDVIEGLFALNRRAGALWALVAEPTVGHDEGRSRELALLFFEEVLPLRLGTPESPLKSLDESSGHLGDLATHAVTAASSILSSEVLRAWLPTERAAQAWRAVVTNTPFGDDERE